MIDLTVRVGGLTLANPVMPASGTFAEGLDKVMDFNRLGAFVTKTITRELRAGNPLPRVVERPGGLINSIGIPSRGVPYFLEHTLPYYQRYAPPLVVSISAPTAEDFAGLAAELSRPGIAAIEANISCPNIEEDGKAFAMSAASTDSSKSIVPTTSDRSSTRLTNGWVYSVFSAQSYSRREDSVLRATAPESPPRPSIQSIWSASRNSVATAGVL